MRRKREVVLSFAGKDDDLPKTVREYREKYRGISVTLDLVPEVLDLVHEELAQLSQGGDEGRSADFSSETILRSLVVQTVEGLSYRETTIRIADSEFLQDFIRTRKKAVMDHTFLNKCFKAIRPETWKQVNELVGNHFVQEGCIHPDTIRTDTTVVETNIHWPTDASLLWDTWRVASRILQRGRAVVPESVPHRFHDRKVKQLYLNITRYITSKSKKRQRQVKRAFRTLIQRVTRIVGIVEEFCAFSSRISSSLDLAGLGLQLEAFVPSMKQVVHQASRAQIHGEKVPASERVFSIFEPHTELIKRGRRHKPVEFGHAVLLCQTQEKFITDYEVFEDRPADCDLTEQVIDRHERLFGEPPEVLAGDKGFCPDAETYEELEERVGTLAIPRRMRDFADAVMTAWQAFRAGIEGTISGLKRAFRLARCYFRTFKSFQASIGLGVFCHNLIVLSATGET
jgi:IS5 family transposase